MPYTLTPATPWDVDIDDVDYLEDRPEGGDRWVLNFGPQHPATHTTLRIVMELDGERVVRATPHIGYLHSGFEKLGEHHDYNQYVCTISRMDYISPVLNDVAWHHAVESLFDIDITPRCKVVRTILMELGRLQGHLLCVGAAALDLGAFTGFLYGFNEREFIYDIMDFYSGQRFHPDVTRVGGMMLDLPDEDIFKQEWFASPHRRPPAQGDQGPRNPAQSQSHLHRSSAGHRCPYEGGRHRLVADSGPLARASGVARDLRKDAPTSATPTIGTGRAPKPSSSRCPWLRMATACLATSSGSRRSSSRCRSSTS